MHVNIWLVHQHIIYMCRCIRERANEKAKKERGCMCVLMRVCACVCMYTHIYTHMFNTVSFARRCATAFLVWEVHSRVSDTAPTNDEYRETALTNENYRRTPSDKRSHSWQDLVLRLLLLGAQRQISFVGAASHMPMTIQTNHWVRSYVSFFLSWAVSTNCRVRVLPQTTVIYIYISSSLYVCICICVCIHIYIYRYVHIYIYIYI